MKTFFDHRYRVRDCRQLSAERAILLNPQPGHTAWLEPATKDAGRMFEALGTPGPGPAAAPPPVAYPAYPDTICALGKEPAAAFAGCRSA